MVVSCRVPQPPPPSIFLWQMVLKKIAFTSALDPEPAHHSSNASFIDVQWKVGKEERKQVKEVELISFGGGFFPNT